MCACGAIIRSHKGVYLPEIANKKRETLPETATPPPYVIGREDLARNGYGERGYVEEVTSGIKPISEHMLPKPSPYIYTYTYTCTYALHVHIHIHIHIHTHARTHARTHTHTHAHTHTHNWWRTEFSV